VGKREQRLQRRALGLCGECGAPSPEHYRCPNCRAYVAERKRRSRETAPKVELSPLPPQIEGHDHFWVLDSPTGVTSIGRCECGAERTFYNSYEPDAKFGAGKPITNYGDERLLDNDLSEF